MPEPRRAAPRFVNEVRRLKTELEDHGHALAGYLLDIAALEIGHQRDKVASRSIKSPGTEARPVTLT